MKRTEWLQETRKMRFEEAYVGYKKKKPYAIGSSIAAWGMRSHIPALYEPP